MVTSCSFALAERLKTFWGCSPDIEVVPNPVDHHLFAPIRNYYNREKPVIGYFGRLEKRKGIDVLCKAFEIVIKSKRSAQLWFVGEDQKIPHSNITWKKQIQNHLGNSALRNIQFFGSIERNKLPEIYDKCDLCVIPSSRFENLPYACLEAMACGKAIIASHCGGIPEILDNGKYGKLVLPNDADQLAKAILDILDSDSERIKFSKKARERIVEKYTREDVAKATELVYKRITV